MGSRIVVSAVLVGLVAACTVQSDKMDNYEATRAYLAPTFCAKQQECAANAFSITWGSDDSRAAKTDADRQQIERAACEKHLNDEIHKEELKLTECTNEEYQQCRTDMRAAQCPTDIAKTGGLPPLPPSCSKC